MSELIVHCFQCGWQGVEGQLKKKMTKDAEISTHKAFRIEVDICPECKSEEIGFITT